MNRRFFRYYYLRFIRLQGDPKEIARGVGLGIFVGITPTIPLHTILILLLALFFRANKLAGLLASCVVSNPLTFFLQYYLSWRLGTWLTPYELSWERIHEIMAIISGHSGFRETLTELSKLGWHAIAVMLAGGIALAIPFAVSGYFLSLYFYKSLRLKKQRQRAESLASYDPADDQRYP
ncbi:MAG: DUF2062 domain-containing protein [Deltaproteobacteria bacterium]|nr:DUF2062 domain-containing protein [Deltaproteobacteria bacterium]